MGISVDLGGDDLYVSNVFTGYNSSGKVPASSSSSTGGLLTLTPTYAGAGNLSAALNFISPSPILAATHTFGYGTDGAEAGELTLSTSSLQNVLEIKNTNINGFSAIAFSGKDNQYTDTTTVFEHMAIGWIPSQKYCVIETSTFDFAGNALIPPSELRFQQTGGVDTSGGTNVTCGITNTLTSITTAGVLGSNGQLITGTGIQPATTLVSGGGTTSGVMSKPATITNGSVLLNFSTPAYSQYTYFQATRTGPVYFTGWNGAIALTIDRNHSTIGVGTALQNQGVPAATLEVGGTAQINSTLSCLKAVSFGLDYATPTTGSTYTLPSDKSIGILEPAGTLATLTIKMPASPIPGQTASFSTTQTITSLTVSPNSGQVIRAGTTPTTLGIGGVFKMIYNVNTVWYPCS